MIRPNQSWVARWNGLKENLNKPGKLNKPGTYAIAIVADDYDHYDDYENEEKVLKSPHVAHKKHRARDSGDGSDGHYSVGSDEN
jgi:hypothetical protein